MALLFSIYLSNWVRNNVNDQNLEYTSHTPFSTLLEHFLFPACCFEMCPSIKVIYMFANEKNNKGIL